MVYLNSFLFPNREAEFNFFINIKRTVYDTYYPFQVLSQKGFTRMDCAPITILYGGNGSGKTTALNIIAEKLALQRQAKYNRSNFFEDYLKYCEADLYRPLPKESRIITSDDVFDYILNIRTVNEGIDEKREEMFEEYLSLKHSKFQLRSLDDYEQLRQVVEARRKTQSRFVRQEMPGNVREYSNGENAFRYFTNQIEENGLYLLDEPENSLSPARQLELVQFIEDSARFFGCQFIISTHSPFLLALKEARIYDLDTQPVVSKKWTELENVRTYYAFFQKYQDEFRN